MYDLFKIEIETLLNELKKLIVFILQSLVLEPYVIIFIFLFLQTSSIFFPYLQLLFTIAMPLLERISENNLLFALKYSPKVLW